MLAAMSAAACNRRYHFRRPSFQCWGCVILAIIDRRGWPENRNAGDAALSIKNSLLDESSLCLTTIARCRGENPAGVSWNWHGRVKQELTENTRMAHEMRIQDCTKVNHYENTELPPVCAETDAKSAFPRRCACHKTSIPPESRPLR